MQKEIKEKPRSAIVAAVQLSNVSDVEFEASLADLRDLAKTLGYVIAFDEPEAVRANPKVQEAYLGSVAYGLSATFYGEITLDKGRVKELNFDTYPILRLPQMPKVDTVIVPT